MKAVRILGSLLVAATIGLGPAVVRSAPGAKGALATTVAEPAETTPTVPGPAPAARLEHRWPRWVPWAIAGFGALVGLASLPLFLSSQADFSDYDEAFVDWCGTAGACNISDLPTSIADLNDRATAKRNAGIALAGLGGAAVITGLVLAILNRPRIVRSGLLPGSGPARLTLQPLLLRGGAMLSGALRF